MNGTSNQSLTITTNHIRPSLPCIPCDIGAVRSHVLFPGSEMSVDSFEALPGYQYTSSG